MDTFRPARRALPWPNLTPMIDVVFLLVAFFMLSATFVKREAALTLTLPAATAPLTAPDPTDVVVSLGAAGELEVDGVATSLDELPTRIAAGPEDARVVLRAADTVAHGRVVEVLDAFRREGVRDLAIATEPLASEPVVSEPRADR